MYNAPRIITAVKKDFLDISLLYNNPAKNNRPNTELRMIVSSEDKSIYSCVNNVATLTNVSPSSKEYLTC